MTISHPLSRAQLPNSPRSASPNVKKSVTMMAGRPNCPTSAEIPAPRPIANSAVWVKVRCPPRRFASLRPFVTRYTPSESVSSRGEGLRDRPERAVRRGPGCARSGSSAAPAHTPANAKRLGGGGGPAPVRRKQIRDGETDRGTGHCMGCTHNHLGTAPFEHEQHTIYDGGARRGSLGPLSADASNAHRPPLEPPAQAGILT